MSLYVSYGIVDIILGSMGFKDNKQEISSLKILDIYSILRKVQWRDISRLRHIVDNTNTEYLGTNQ